MLFLLAMALLSGCKTAEQGVPIPHSVQAWSPKGLVFSTTVDQASDWQSVWIGNYGSDRPRTVTAIRLEGGKTEAFEIGEHTLPITVGFGVQSGIRVRVAKGNAPGVARTNLLLISEGSSDIQTIPLSALVAVGIEGHREPTLHQIVNTLGIDINVGGEQLSLSKEPVPIGDGVEMPYMIAAGPRPVYITPVARYSPDFEVPFGYYTNDWLSLGPPISRAGFQNLKYSPVASLATKTNHGDASRNHNRLIPPITDDTASLSFNPTGAFGLFCKSPTHFTHTDPALNVGQGHKTQYAVRTYPVPDWDNTYLICFEEAANGDYQDYVFVITNVRPPTARELRPE